MLHIFLERFAAEALNARLLLKSMSHDRENEGTVAAVCETVNYLPKMYATDNIIVETDANMMPFPKPKNKSRTEYAKALCNKATIC